MPDARPLQHVSEAPTRPEARPKGAAGFDVADLYRGPLGVETGGDAATAPRLDEKLRQAYFWITNQAIISPFYDIEYNDEPPQRFTFGDSKVPVTLPSRSPIMKAARSRTSTICVGSSPSPGASTSPPRSSRTGQ